MSDIQVSILTSKEAANYLKISEYTLRRSRMDGTLCGSDSPPFIKMGRQVKYLLDDLDSWLNQLPKFNSIAEQLLPS